MVYKAIVSHNSETIINFELEHNCQYHLSSSVHNWIFFWHGVDIFVKFFERLIILYISYTVTPCSSSPCQNEGRCVVVDGNYVCVCPHGFNGPECQGN